MSNIVDLIADSVLQDCEVFEYFSDSREFWRLSGLGIFHMNIGRLRSNFNELMLIISPYLVNIDIIILTETWHHPSFPYSFSIPGYNSYFTSQQHNEASGIAVYVRDDLDVQTDELTQFTMTNCLKLDLKLTDKRLTILTMYRSPSGNNAPRFIEELDQYLSQLTCDRCLLVGDLNINILDQNMTNMGHDYLDILHGHNYIPTITKPTRVKINKRQDGQTFKTESCIDHTMYKSRNINEIRSSIIQTNISDHYSIATKLNLNFDKQTTPTTKQYRHIDFDLLKDKLNNQDWTCITNSDDVNFTANQLTEIIEDHISSSSEIKNYTNRLTPIKPWMTQALLRSIRNRDRLARLTKRNPDNIRLHDYYKRVRNIVSKSIRTARDLDIKRRYMFKLTVYDDQGLHSDDTVSIIVKPDPLTFALTTLTLNIQASLISQSQASSLLLKLNLLLNPEHRVVPRQWSMDPDSKLATLTFLVNTTRGEVPASGLVQTARGEVEVGGAKVNGATRLVQPVRGGGARNGGTGLVRSSDVVGMIRDKLRLNRAVLDLDIVALKTFVCQNPCSGHGKCIEDTRICLCDSFWMRNLYARALTYDPLLYDDNCAWSILYVILALMLALTALLGVCACVCFRAHGGRKVYRSGRSAYKYKTMDKGYKEYKGKGNREEGIRLSAFPGTSSGEEESGGSSLEEFDIRNVARQNGVAKKMSMKT
ncbi:hypothetical protein M8J76_001545 [Diaphorina citri]|nr:hypothetical protein M8J76_001545 [Diaphorina citri]